MLFNADNFILEQKSVIFIAGILIGNKKDLEKRRRVSFEDASEFAEKNSIKYFECSAVSF